MKGSTLIERSYRKLTGYVLGKAGPETRASLSVGLSIRLKPDLRPGRDLNRGLLFR